MKHIVRKAYWNYEKEERWLNDMAAKGLALTGYSWCRYTFEDCVLGDYIYRIELLGNSPSHPGSQKYLKFLEETGITHVASYMRWVYLRKKASSGPFDLYTDIDSKIAHYNKVSLLWLGLAAAELCVAFGNITIGLIDTPLKTVNLVLGCIVLVMGFLFLGIGLPLRRKMRRLRKERAIREV